MRTVLILGATSTIAWETAKRLASKRMNLILTGRNVEALELLKRDLEARHDVHINVMYLDALDYDHHEMFFSEVTAAYDLDGVMLMYGELGDQKEAETSFTKARHMIDVNYTSAVSMLNLAATYFEKKRRGFIVAVSSVAGDHGRKSNYIYGSTKAGLSTYMEGLRNRLHKAGVQVLTIKPGLVATKMTQGTANENSRLLARPQKVAKAIVKHTAKRRNVVYTPGFWLVIMLVVKLMPERLFKRTDF